MVVCLSSVAVAVFSSTDLGCWEMEEENTKARRP